MTRSQSTQVGTALSKGDQASVVESVKAAAEVYAPIDGEIAAINEALEDAPETVNSSPYEEGWLFKVRPSSTATPCSRSMRCLSHAPLGMK